MHLIIRYKYLDRLYDFVYTIFTFVRKKDEKVLFKCEKEQLVFYINTEVFYTKIELKKGENLEIKKEGSCIVEINFLNTLLQALEFENDLEVYKAEDNFLQFFSGRFSCNLLIIDNAKIVERDFQITEGQEFLIHYSVLKSAFSRLKDFCRSSDSTLNTNPVLTSIHIKNNLDQEKLEFWASDSFRVVCGRFPYSFNKKLSMNIPATFMNVILGIMKEEKSDDLRFWYEDNIFTLKSESITFRTKLDTRSYPDFEKWFNESTSYKRFMIDRDDLLYAMDRNLLFLGKEMKNTNYIYESGRLCVEYKDNERGYCKEFLAVSTIDPEKIEFFVNNQLFKALIKNIPSKEIIFSFSNSFNPIVIITTNPNDNFRQFILPIRNA